MAAPDFASKPLGTRSIFSLIWEAIVLFFIAGDISKAISLKVPSSPIKCCPYWDRLGDNLFKMSSSLPITLIVHMWVSWDLQVYEKVILSWVKSWGMNVVWRQCDSPGKHGKRAYKLMVSSRKGSTVPVLY